MKMEKRPTSDQSWRGFTTRGNHQQPQLLCFTVYSHLLGGRARKMQKKIPKKYLLETKDDYTMQSAFKMAAQLIKLLQCKLQQLVGLEMLRDEFLASRLGQKVSPKQIFGLNI